MAPEYPQYVPAAYLVPLNRFRSKLDIDRFDNIATAAGLCMRGRRQAGGSIFDDFNNDGWPDLLVTSGGMPKSVHAALRLDCFLVDVCVTSSSCSSSTFNSARHSSGVQRQPVRRSLAIASRVCSTISSHRPDTTAARN